jgi:inhibitor of cysteine peptidase
MSLLSSSHRWHLPGRRQVWLVAVTILILTSLLAGCGGDSAPGMADVETVEVKHLPGSPPSYVAIASGFLRDGCTEIDRITQRKKDTAIRITILTARPKEAMCTMALVPFEERIELDVKGLPAGSYSANVNGVVTSFTLAEDH